MDTMCGHAEHVCQHGREFGQEGGKKVTWTASIRDEVRSTDSMMRCTGEIFQHGRKWSGKGNGETNIQSQRGKGHCSDEI